MPQVVKAHFCIQIAICKCFSVLFVKSCSGKYSAVSGAENIFGRYVKKRALKPLPINKLFFEIFGQKKRSEAFFGLTVGKHITAVYRRCSALYLHCGIAFVNIGPFKPEDFTATLPDEIHNKLDKRTDPTWPTTWFAPRLTGKGAFRDVYSVMANWGANHGAISYGHIGKDLITLASMLRIPVAMHNVADEDIYRPHAWSAFGTKDLESVDYRACAAYGPLYKLR